VQVVDRDADDYSALGWKTVCGPTEDKEMVTVTLKDDTVYRIAKSDSGKTKLFILQEQEQEAPAPAPAKKERKQLPGKIVTRCAKVHEKSGLRCVKEAGHDGQCFLDMCKQAHDDGVQICRLAKGHDGDHVFINPQELK